MVVRVCVRAWGGVLCPLGHSQLDPPPGQWRDHCQQVCPEAIFIQGVFKGFYVVTACFSFLLCCSLKYLVKEGKKKTKETNTYFLLHSETFF